MPLSAFNFLSFTSTDSTYSESIQMFIMQTASQ